MIRSYLFILFITTVEAGVFNRYYPNPRVTQYGEVGPHKTYIDKKFKKVDCVASFGLSAGMRDEAEKSIIEHYTGILANTGEESNLISEDMENAFGGFWMVGIFSADFDMAYTITRRSKNYGLFTIDDKMILIAKDGNTQTYSGPVY